MEGHVRGAVDRVVIVFIGWGYWEEGTWQTTLWWSRRASCCAGERQVHVGRENVPPGTGVLRGEMECRCEEIGIFF